ncbi:transmembrane protein, putative [Medicago truncatula]|uniref:Transmembrane protein, putative n=1 Tax=Medicago truncatula TaxID=3880 RepID=G7KDG5_MEDTR|nr:transmembrane protein, putative [Medicago truncatula]
MASWRRVISFFCLFVLFSIFFSLLDVLSSNPAQMGEEKDEDEEYEDEDVPVVYSLFN